MSRSTARIKTSGEGISTRVCYITEIRRSPGYTRNTRYVGDPVLMYAERITEQRR